MNIDLKRVFKILDNIFFENKEIITKILEKEKL